MRVRIFRVPYDFIMRRCMKSKKAGTPFSITYVGYAEVEQFDEQKVWDLCNWSCCSKGKPDNLFANINVANTDVFFYNPETKLYYIPLVAGWVTKTSLKEVAEHYLQENLQEGFVW